jgi:DNA-binding XRE family transcriptional regulator
MAKRRKTRGTKRKTTDLLEVLDDRHYRTRAARVRLQEAQAGAEVARQIYTLRKEAGLTQRELAELVGTQDSVVSRLENDDYRGHSLSMLRRIAAALGKRVEIRFVPIRTNRSA